MAPLNYTRTIAPVELNTTKQLPPTGKLYLWYQIHSRYSHAVQCFKSQKINKTIDSILCIDTFETKCVVIRGVLQSPRLECFMKTIGIDQSLCNRSSFEQKHLKNIKKIYQHAGKCEDQQNFNDFLYNAMVSTPEEFIDNSPNVLITSALVFKKC